VDADKGELSGRFGIGIRHAGGIAFVTRRNEFNAGLDQRMRNLEIGRAEQAKTTASAEPCEVLCQDHGDCRIVAHDRLSHLFDSPTHS